ncbi:hypothetical protein [Rufibacter radiotolerans]|uniref:hypothetical protein n=1 Tax=Rufibacter radiotolerans TaxID=1379910 RepID=UPI0012E1FF88|nr:hypothetical protein [Rufibacter radiotolerans]
MMKNTLLVLAVSLFSLAGCSGPRDNKSNTTAPQGVSQPGATATPGTPQAQPWERPAQPAASGATAGLNPPHGQPGHRCDIQVGAPLNSAPATVPVITSGTPSAVPQAPVLPSAPPISTAKGLNPPHGQPGHDCAVPVGAPLSK